MKRKDIEMFNLSFLDILAGALGAVLFLFIVVPKGGGEAPAASPQLSVKFDTTQMTFFGVLPDSMLQHTIGDSLLSLIIDYDEMPSIKNCPEPQPCPKCADSKKLYRTISDLQKSLAERDIYIDNLEKQTQTKPQTRPIEVTPTPAQTTKKTTSPTQTVPAKTPAKSTPTPSKPAAAYKGDMPSVPCNFSVEVKWDDKAHNVDLFLCKDGSCVYGGKQRNKTIGYWDSGKSKTSIFGGDLRSNQEAVRQFDDIIEGDYEIFIQYKASKKDPVPSVAVSGLIYTKTDKKGEQGKTFTANIPFNKENRTKIGSVKVSADGNFTFNRTAR